jgi:hypothetical protein
MTRQFIMHTLGIQENDPRTILLDVLNCNNAGVQINEAQLFGIINSDSINSYFLQPLVTHLLTHPEDAHNDSIVTFLFHTILLQRNAAGTIDPYYLLQNPRNQFASIEQQLFEFLTIKLNSEDIRLVEKCLAVVNGLVNSIGIVVPQALLAQLMNNTVRHYASADARDLASSELLIIGISLAIALSLTPTTIKYDANVRNFHQSVGSLPAKEMYKTQVLQRLEQLQLRSSAAALLARTGTGINSTNQGQSPSSSGKQFGL